MGNLVSVRESVTDRRDLRACLARFATGIAVVAVANDLGGHGITVNSFSSVSLDPPLVMIAVSKTARTHAEILNRTFSVNILGAEQESLARDFAGSGSKELGDVWDWGLNAPHLSSALAYLECAPWGHFEAGDHTIVIGEVVAHAYRDGDALGYFNSRFVSIPETVYGVEFLF